MDRPQHLAADDFDVLVVDGNGLGAVDLLDLVDQVTLQFLDTEVGQNAVPGRSEPCSRRRASRSADRRRGHARLPAR